MSIVDPHALYHRIHGPEISPPGVLPVVLLHGLMGFAANWGKVWPELHQQRPVLVLDQRGHGRSPKPTSGYTPTDYARDLAALLDHLRWKKVHVVGHSMGGRVALRFASLYPESTASLAMEDSGADAMRERVNWICELLASIPTPFADRESAKKFFSENFRSDPMTGGFLHANLEPDATGRLDWRFFAPGMIETVESGRATDAMREFSAIRIPILLIRGGASREFRVLEAEAMCKANPRCRLVTVPGAGHFVHAEKPGEFNRALTRFLQDVEHGTFTPRPS